MNNQIHYFEDKPFYESSVVNGMVVSQTARKWSNQKLEVIDGKVIPEHIHMPHNPLWDFIADQAIDHVKSMMPDGLILDAEHIGSTSIPNIRARDRLAINFAVRSVKEAKEASQWLLDSGFEVCVDMLDVYSVSNPQKIKGCWFQFYFITKMQRQWVFKKAFRNYMRSHPEEARVYEKVKLDLWDANKGDDDAYRVSKSDYIFEILKKCGFTNLKLLDVMEANDLSRISGKPLNLLPCFYGISMVDLGGSHEEH